MYELMSERISLFKVILNRQGNEMKDERAPDLNTPGLEPVTSGLKATFYRSTKRTALMMLVLKHYFILASVCANALLTVSTQG